MKCPKCSGLLVEKDGGFICESCGTRFKKKSTQNEQKQETSNVPNSAEKTEEPTQPTKQDDEKSELELLKERLAEMEKRQAEIESNKGKQRNIDFRKAFTQFKETKFFAFLKKWGLKVVLPCVLVLIVFISLMVSLVGVRGVYYNIDNPNEFYEFTATKYIYHGTLDGIYEYETQGSWKNRNGKLYLSYKDELFGKQTDEYYFSNKNNKELYIGEDKEELSTFKRVGLGSLKSISKKKIKVTFDANGGDFGETKTITKGSKTELPEQTPTREEYQFRGWYQTPYGYKTKGVKAFQEDYRIWENVTYYANWWSDKKYKMTIERFDTNIILELEEGDNLLSRLREFEDSYYTYEYYFDGLTVTEDTCMPAKDIQISYKATANPRKYLFDANGGVINGQSTCEIVISMGQEMPIASKSGYLLVGWRLPDGTLKVNKYADWGYDISVWKADEGTVFVAEWVKWDSDMSALEFINDFCYGVEDDKIYITAFRNLDKETLIIPDCVYAIREQANWDINNGHNIKNIYVPKSVQEINTSIFSKNELFNDTIIHFEGTMEEWYAFGEWKNTVMVICADGTING